VRRPDRKPQAFALDEEEENLEIALQAHAARSGVGMRRADRVDVEVDDADAATEQHLPPLPFPKRIPPPPRVPTFSVYEEALADLGPSSIAPIAVDTDEVVAAPNEPEPARSEEVTTDGSARRRAKVVVAGVVGASVALCGAAGFRTYATPERGIDAVDSAGLVACREKTLDSK
jgi:hypothetical protein